MKAKRQYAYMSETNNTPSDIDVAIRARQHAHIKAASARVREGGDKILSWNPAILSCFSAGEEELANQHIEGVADICSTLQRDCTDFMLNLLLRAYILFPGGITPANRDRIRKAATGNRFYGGHRVGYPMFYNSENHHMCWAVAEFLTAQCFPDDVFSFDGRTAREHYERSRFLIATWIDRRARWGYSEWNSSCYMGVNLESLLNLVDCSADSDIRNLAYQAVTKLLADIAADSLEGGIWGAQARTYESNVFKTSGQSAAGALSMLLGAGDSETPSASGGTMEYYATTSYRPPCWLCDLSRDAETPLVNEERHRGEEDLFYSCRSAFWLPPFELTNPEAMMAFAPDSFHDTPVRTERTAGTIVSAVLGNTRDKLGAQALYWMGSLRGRLSIFTTQPFAKGVELAEDRYWAGTSSVPICYLRDGVLAAVYKGGVKSAGFTHAHFPTSDMSEWTHRGGWFFGRLDDAYVGIRPPTGGELESEGKWAGRDIIAPGLDAVWIVVFGSKSRHDSYPDFMFYCLQQLRIQVAADQSSVDYEVSGHKIHVSRDKVTEDGAVFSCADWPQMNNRLVRHEYGSTQTYIMGSGQPELALDFSQASRISGEWAQRQDLAKL